MFSLLHYFLYKIYFARVCAPRVASKIGIDTRSTYIIWCNCLNNVGLSKCPRSLYPKLAKPVWTTLKMLNNQYSWNVSEGFFRGSIESTGGVSKLWLGLNKDGEIWSTSTCNKNSHVNSWTYPWRGVNIFRWGTKSETPYEMLRPYEVIRQLFLAEI